MEIKIAVWNVELPLRVFRWAVNATGSLTIAPAIQSAVMFALGEHRALVHRAGTFETHAEERAWMRAAMRAAAAEFNAQYRGWVDDAQMTDEEIDRFLGPVPGT